MSFETRYSWSPRTIRVPPAKRNRRSASTSLRRPWSTLSTRRCSGRSNIEDASETGYQRANEVPLLRRRLGEETQVAPSGFVAPQDVEEGQIPIVAVEPGQALQERQPLRQGKVEIRARESGHGPSILWESRFLRCLAA